MVGNSKYSSSIRSRKVTHVGPVRVSVGFGKIAKASANSPSKTHAGSVRITGDHDGFPSLRVMA